MCNVKLRCPKYESGECLFSLCDGFLQSPVQSGYDSACRPLYNGMCRNGGNWEHFKNLHAFAEVSNVAAPPASQDAKTKRKRGKGTSIFDGIRVHQDIVSDSGKSLFKVNEREFRLTREKDWSVADRILEAARDRVHGYEIPLSKEEYNGLSPDGKKLVAYILDREEASEKTGSQKYSGKARIKPKIISVKNI